MVTQTTNGGIEHWLKEEMQLWHTLPLFIVLALLGWGAAEATALFVTVDPALSERMIAAAGLFAGVAMGWTARREYETSH